MTKTAHQAAAAMDDFLTGRDGGGGIVRHPQLLLA